MDFTISIPEGLVPGIIATAHLESVRTGKPITLQMVVQDAAIQAAIQVCQNLKVGDYYGGPILPQFNADGTPYTP